MRIFLSGPMGAGKSSVAEAIGARTGRPIVDLDARVAARAGRSIAEIFREQGETAFRALERAEVVHVLAQSPEDGVVALGGGTVCDRATRRALLHRGVLVTLSASVDVLRARVAGDRARPLLSESDAGEVLLRLLAERADAYAECHAAIDTSRSDVGEVARAVLAAAGDPPVVVPLGARTYRVEIHRGARRELPRHAAQFSGAIVLVTDTTVEPLHGSDVRELLETSGRRVIRVAIGAGEAHKSLASVERIWDAALAAKIDREALVIALGGGVVGDVAGLAAGTLLRGVALGQVPTTLLAMVDSAVGGKAAIDRPEGKNLVGVIHQPSFVLADPELLSTLPAPERIAGLAEVVKCAWLSSESAVAGLEKDATALRAGEGAATTAAIRMAVSCKARIVAEDEHENGERRLLNLGHTIGHALEAAGGYGALRHGEAVALGLVAACRVARAMGRLEPQDERRMAALLGGLGLPTDLEPRLDARALAFVGADKKRVGDAVRFILPGPPGSAEVAMIPMADLLRLMS